VQGWTVLTLIIILLCPPCFAAADSTQLQADVAASIASQKAESSSATSVTLNPDEKIRQLEQEFAEFKNTMSNKYVSWASFILAAIAFVAALISALGSWIAHLTVRSARADLKREVTYAREWAGKEIEGFEKDLSRGRAMIEHMYKSFWQMLRGKQELTSRLIREFGDLLLEKADRDRMREIFDQVWEEELQHYDLGSYVLDLTSPDKDERIRAIWGIEGMGTKENIKDLQKVADNKDEDREVMQEAERAIGNMKRRLGV
jgi:hypothetical protein